MPRGSRWATCSANRKLRFFQFGKAISLSWYTRHVTAVRAVAPARFMALSAPVLPRVLSDGLTVRKRIAVSRVPVAMTSVAMRRALRPAGQAMRALPPASGAEVEREASRKHS